MYSKLSTYNKQPKEHWNIRNHEIDSIAIHCTAGNINSTARQLVDYFYNLDRDASCNYVIGGDGSIGGCVEEQNRSWCTSNKACDMRSITIEVATENIEPFIASDKALTALQDLLVDICYRYNITLKWSYDKNERINNLNGVNMKCHRDYKAKSCPGNFLYNLEEMMADIVNKKVEELRLQNKEEVTMPDTNNIPVGSTTKIQGTSVIEQDIMEEVLKGKISDEYIDILKYYYEAEQAYGLRADLLIAQSILETGWFKFGGYVKPEWNNFAGIGITDTNAAVNKAIFDTPQDGVIAQFQHMFAYVYNTGDPESMYPDWKLIDPRFKLVSRGCAPYVEWLGSQENPNHVGWATGKNYGGRILNIYSDLLTDATIKLSQKNVEDLSKKLDVPDYIVQINPTKIYKYATASLDKIIGVVERSKQVILEEQDGFGMLEDGSWIQLCFTTYLKDIDN